MKRNVLFIVAAGLLMLFLAIGVSDIAHGSALAATTPIQAPSGQVSAMPGADATLGDLQTALEDVYAQVNPSVVTIRTVSNSGGMPLPNFDQPNSPSAPELYQQGLGSGFVWDNAGHIVTNDHVVSGADNVSVIFADGETTSARVVGSDPTSDLAVIQVNAPSRELSPVQLGDSGQVKVGQIAIAIGNPFGEQSTMTMGIISALDRSLPANEGRAFGASFTIPDVIQTDAPINPGNSGGVLLDVQGKVIGVTSAIDSPMAQSAGIGFAIPANIVSKVVPELIASGHYDHPWLGISGTTLTPELAKAMNLDADQHGILIKDVSNGGPAAKADLHASTRLIMLDGQQTKVGGDVIVAFNGTSIKTFDQLVAALADSTTVGQKIPLLILRDGKQQTIDVMLMARPESIPQAN